MDIQRVLRQFPDDSFECTAIYWLNFAKHERQIGNTLKPFCIHIYSLSLSLSFN